MKRTELTNGAKLGAMSFAERLNLVSKKRREVIRPVQEKPRDYVLLTIRGAAKKLETDPATVLRIVRGMGFGNYKEFKAYLHELSIASATSLEGMQSENRDDSSLVSHGRRALDQDIQNITALRNTLNMQQVVGLAKRIHEAQSIVLIGGDMAASLVEFLDYKLTLLGFRVVSATSAGKIVHAVRNLGKKDLVIGISFRRGLRQTVEGVEQARANGAYCVGITNTFISPLARLADECFLAAVESPLSNSYAAPMSFLNVLLTVCAHYRRSRTLSILRKVDQEQRYGYRWYPA
jgi:DNA-binding MurR/RpiR family transcriptional regulator